MDVVVRFQGVCFFRRPRGGRGLVRVYLPEASDPGGDYGGVHRDGSNAHAHRACLLVPKRHVQTVDGEVEEIETVIDGGGLYLVDLNTTGIEEPGLSIHFPMDFEQDLQAGALDTLTSFEKGPGPLRLAEAERRSAATLRAAQGVFSTVRAPGPWRWRLKRQNGPSPRTVIGRTPWLVKWHFEVDHRTGSTYDIFVRQGGPRGSEVARLALRRQANHAVSVIIGNVDEEYDPGTWDSREPEPTDGCRGGPTCPDDDFKWFYRLFARSDVDDLLTEYDELPVPELDKGVSFFEDEYGASTPTCLPGTC